MAEPAVQEFAERARQTWAAGHWDDVSDLIAGVGPKLLDRVGIEPGMTVLDVGAGSGGTLSIPAAQRGARVVASDIAPEHFEDGRRRASEAGVEIEWVEANAEELPFEDESFDRVLSTFGHMFAPRHERAGAELARVCRTGGIVGFATWLPDSPIGRTFTTVGSYMPPPPDFAQPPPIWGDEQHVREILEPQGLDLEFDVDTNVFVFDGDPDEYMSWTEERLGPLVSAKAAVGDRWPELRRDLVSITESGNEADDGTVRLPSRYLVTIGRKR